MISLAFEVDGAGERASLWASGRCTTQKQKAEKRKQKKIRINFFKIIKSFFHHDDFPLIF